VAASRSQSRATEYLVTTASPTGSAASSIPASSKRRGYRLAAGVLLVTMAGGTLPIPLYVLYERQMGFGPLGVTVVFAAFVVGTVLVLLTLGDLSDHIGRRKVLAIAVASAAVATALFLVATGAGLLITARIVGGLAAGFVTGTAAAALAELQPRGDRRAAAVAASGSNMTGLGAGPLAAGIFAQYVTMPTRSVFWAYLGLCALALAAVAAIPGAGPPPGRGDQGRSPPGRPAGHAGRDAGNVPGRFRRIQHPGVLRQPGAHFPARHPRRAQPRPDRGDILPDLHHSSGQPGGLREAASTPQHERRATVAADLPRRPGIGAVRQGAVAVPGRHHRRRHRRRTHLPRRPDRAQPARRAPAPRRRRVHVLCRLLPRH